MLRAVDPIAAEVQRVAEQQRLEPQWAAYVVSQSKPGGRRRRAIRTGGRCYCNGHCRWRWGAVPLVAKTRFFGTVSLDPIQAKKQFAVLVDEVILQFTKDARVNVRIAIEINADSAPGFGLALRREVKENCIVLAFKSAEFEE